MGTNLVFAIALIVAVYFTLGTISVVLMAIDDYCRGKLKGCDPVRSTLWYVLGIFIWPNLIRTHLND